MKGKLGISCADVVRWSCCEARRGAGIWSSIFIYIEVRECVGGNVSRSRLMQRPSFSSFGPGILVHGDVESSNDLHSPSLSFLPAVGR